MAVILFNDKWLVVFVIYLSLTHAAIDEPIVYKTRYSQFWQIGASWSTTSKHSDYSTSYLVVNYRDYARSFEDFAKKYPTVEIETFGRAYSAETFGDKGSGHFGKLTYETMHFSNSEFYNQIIVQAYESAFWYNVGVEIGVGFKRQGEFLVVRPFINGWIYSGGAVWRYLDFGLGVTSITFQPADEISNDV